ncbi:uncharacterized protein LOC128895733 [Hylaeus anthracinus]|uniref:uncharacterized protein LOC128876962 n=1 Tax=Hylaeus volcanicus TaxID=313075 RepID=UPI0023B79547|nr:uncharacterized protein LOC128876962 [Hylaeus volcanicus]XP_054014565.1 uncharacterized protein LOC128895733 [Hylaeus anthracinus]
MTMEDRTGGIDRAAPATSTTATTALTSSSPSSISDVTSDASYPIQRANKRSFDVAFLVAPDENLARRQSEKLRLVSTRKDRHRDVISTDRIVEVVDSDRLPQNLTIKNYESDTGGSERRRMMQCTDNSLSPPYITSRTLTPTLPCLSPDNDARRYVSSSRLQKTPSPPAFGGHQSLLTCPDSVETGLACSKVYESGIPCSSDRHGESRSAFTKVNLTAQRNGFNDDGQTSPRSSISPDDRASYQSSVSPPAVPFTAAAGYKYAPFPAKISYPFLVSPETSQPGLLENLKIPQIPQPPKVPSPKMPSFRPDLPPVYPNLSYNPISVFPPMADALARPRFLATAAGVAGLLPPSFTALTLQAQNVCAKCNLSFRMTSDLVYHMRSHHKNENIGESSRRRREEKLRCPVCDESFRERHHLTRHMTAHQDKESDAIVDQVEVKRRATTVHSK